MVNMPETLPRNLKHIHFVGIKGVGLANLALYAKQQGIKVTGSDVAEVFVTDSVLAENGIGWSVGFSRANIPGNPDLVIATAGHGGMTNPEVEGAKEAGLKVLTYAQALGLFMEGSYGISVCGVGGKGSTSSLLAEVLVSAGTDPSYIIGVARINPLGFGAHYGLGPHFVAEADDYVACPLTDRQPKFNYQKPKMIIVTNIEYDHPDVYPNFKATKIAFAKFFNALPEDGLLVANIDNAGVREVLKQYHGCLATYGFSPEAEYRITGDKLSPNEQDFNVAGIGNFQLHIPGRYNVLNAAAAAVAASKLGLSPEKIKAGIGQFQGMSRRFEFVAKINSIDLYDDYAHHPQEIAGLIDASREWFPNRRLIIIFQPHTFSRTRALFEEFAAALGKADLILLLDIYASAREQPDPGVSSETLSGAVKKYNQNVHYLPKTADLTDFLKKNKKSGDVVITVGAGDIFLSHPVIIKALER